jgi:hypothetical protein
LDEPFFHDSGPNDLLRREVLDANEIPIATIFQGFADRLYRQPGGFESYRHLVALSDHGGRLAVLIGQGFTCPNLPGRAHAENFGERANRGTSVEGRQIHLYVFHVGLRELHGGEKPE